MEVSIKIVSFFSIDYEQTNNILSSSPRRHYVINFTLVNLEFNGHFWSILCISTSSEEEDQLENDELDSDAEAEFLLDPSLQLGEWLNQLQVLSQHNVRVVIEETNNSEWENGSLTFEVLEKSKKRYTVLQLVNVKETVVFGVPFVDSTKQVLKEEIRF
ncbi:hypothetical protein T07_8204 [Trichinella nelsoni]|uniref:Uncharacterized protein n=1 Tax=Trichinella nelsoni TaxID=6336 RepID=A0A0V0SGJ7_9BILA|nr:hypothetical protein T07_8204 [Trichinella nelsoni]